MRNLRLVMVIALLLIACFSTGCALGQSAGPASTPTVEAPARMEVDFVSLAGGPFAGATISIGAADGNKVTGTTDSSGHFSAGVSEIGQYSAVFSIDFADGRVPSSCGEIAIHISNGTTELFPADSQGDLMPIKMTLSGVESLIVGPSQDYYYQIERGDSIAVRITCP